jgi:hypothetical protein
VRGSDVAAKCSDRHFRYKQKQNAAKIVKIELQSSSSLIPLFYLPQIDRDKTGFESETLQYIYRYSDAFLDSIFDSVLVSRISLLYCQSQNRIGKGEKFSIMRWCMIGQAVVQLNSVSLYGIQQNHTRATGI